MISANDLKSKNFTVVESGYSIEEVDYIINEAANTIDAFTTESENLYHKLEVLAAKVEEYREEEDSIKSALIVAQKMADKIKKESNETATLLITKSEESAKETLANANEEADKIITSAREFSSTLISEKTEEANNIIAEAQTKANEAINSAKIVAQDILDQAKAISDDLIAKSEEEKEAYNILVKTIKEDAKNFVANLKSLYTEQLEILDGANFETSSDEQAADADNVESIQQDVDSLVSEIDEIAESIPEAIEIEEIDAPAVEEEPSEEIEEVEEFDPIVEEIPVPEEFEEIEEIEEIEKIGEIEEFLGIIADDDEEIVEEVATPQTVDPMFEIVEDDIEFEIPAVEEEQEEEIEELEEIEEIVEEEEEEITDPMEAVAAFSKTEFTPYTPSEPVIPQIDEEPVMEEKSLFDNDDEQLPFESYFNVSKDDAHNDRSKTVSLVPPEDEDDDQPRFKGFFKKKK